MKKIFLFSVLCAVIKLSAQQTPWTGVDIPNFNSHTVTITAPYELYSPLQTPGPVVVDQNAQVDFVASQYVHLEPGFHAGNFTGNGYFHAQIGAAPDFDVAFIEPNEHIPNVGQYEKLEIGMTLPATLEQQVNTFLANGTGGLNPFDPDQVSVEANFTNGAQSYIVFGFYFDDFIRDQSTIQSYPDGHPEQRINANWISQPTNYHWRIRFAPPTLGNWYCSISIRVNNASNYSYAVNNLYFQCVPSSNKGWLKKGATDETHLTYDNNESFFAIGQCIAWNGDAGPGGQPFFRGGYQIANFPALHDDGLLDELDFISDLSDNGGNMVRIATVPWCYDFEFEHLNNYKDRMNRAWELDQLFQLCEQKNMKISLDFEFLGKGDGNTGSPFEWASNPYHNEIPSVVNPEDFFTDATARNILKKKIRYLLSRWGYSTSLGILAIAGEIDNGFDPYGNNTTLQENQTEWMNDLFGFSKGMMDYRPLLTTTSYASGVRGSDFRGTGLNGILRTPFNLLDCDITCMHSYHDERRVNLKRLDEFTGGIINQGLLFTWPDKPTYFQEMGIDAGLGVSTNGVDPGDMEGCSDVAYHNSLWATAFMGGFGTGFYWYQWHRNDFRHNTYPALNAFFSDIDFQNIKFKDADFWDDAPAYDILPNSAHHLSTIETFYIRDEHADRVMGWVHNSTYWWGNIVLNCPDRNNNLPNTNNIGDDDPASSPQSLPLHTKYELHGMNILQNYTFNLYLTRFPGGLFTSTTEHANIFGTLKPEFETGLADWAFKAYRAGNNFRVSNEITSDTLLCSDDTIHASGKYVFDTLGNFQYFWNFGNGQTSRLRNPIVIYSEPGSYLVTLIVSDTLGFADTLQQYIVKLACNNPSPRKTKSFSDSPHCSIYPNPANNFVNFVLDSSWKHEVKVSVISLQSKIVYSKTFFDGEQKIIEMNGLDPGVYFIRFQDAEQEETVRVIIIK